MPTTEAILALLTIAAHRAIGVAVAWHAAVLAAVIALAAGWRPSTRWACELLALPLLSVAAVAVATGNSFNAVVFSALALLLAALARKVSLEPVKLASPVAVGIGVVMLVVAWFYPHFLDDLYPVAYLFAAPLGVVPCATLYMVIGISLVGGLGGRAWSAVLAASGLIYGVTGVAVLGVWLDVGLIVGGLALAVELFRKPRVVTRDGTAAAH